MPRALHPDLIAGGQVTQGFRSGDKFLAAGTLLSKETICSWPTVNRNALIEKGYVMVYPKVPGMDRHVVSCGFGKFNVIEGKLLNDEPLTKADAYALAGTEPPQKEAPARKTRQ
jgi:hypothetical protein